MCLANFTPEEREMMQHSETKDRVKAMDQKILSGSEIRSRSILKINDLARNNQGFESAEYRTRIINVYFDGMDCQFKKMAESLDADSSIQPYQDCYETSENHAPNN